MARCSCRFLAKIIGTRSCRIHGGMTAPSRNDGDWSVTARARRLALPKPIGLTINYLRSAAR